MYATAELRALNRWEFEKLPNGEYHTVIDNIEIQWNVNHHHGVAIIDGQIQLLHNFYELDDIMEQTPIY